MEQYKCSSKKGKRFLLQKEGKKTMLFIGGSPSSADQFSLDPTSRNIEKLANKNNCDGWAIVNLHSEIIDCYDNISDEVSELSVKENLEFIKNFISDTEIHKVVVGWGNVVSRIPYLEKVSFELMEMLKDFNVECIDTTQKGNPYSASPMAINRNFGGISNVELKPFKSKVVEYDLMRDLDIILKTVKNILNNH